MLRSGKTGIRERCPHHERQRDGVDELGTTCCTKGGLQDSSERRFLIKGQERSTEPLRYGKLLKPLDNDYHASAETKEWPGNASPQGAPGTGAGCPSKESKCQCATDCNQTKRKKHPRPKHIGQSKPNKTNQHAVRNGPVVRQHNAPTHGVIVSAQIITEPPGEDQVVGGTREYAWDEQEAEEEC